MGERNSVALVDESALLARLRDAQEAVRARDDFIAIAAHELRSPMSALALRLQMLELLAERTNEVRLRDEIQRTRRSVDRYVRRAVVLLDVTRLNAGEVTLSRTRVNIRHIVREVVEAHADEAVFHRVSLTADVETDAAGLWDPQMLEQILSNLVNNAIKYGGGTPVRLHAIVQDGVARFEISDGGPGISAEQRARIFEKFERAVPNAGYRSGYGLGLWIVGRMVAAHGGTIDVTAAPGGGARFVVSLPLEVHPGSGEGP
jgi:two-component system, OmpR family, sensor kinase